MSSDPIRAALERLLNAMDGPPCDPFERLKALDAASAALAAVPEREPSDEELRDLWSWSSGQDQGPWPTQYHCFARAVLARWGRPAAPPAPMDGEVVAATQRLEALAAFMEPGSQDRWVVENAASLLAQISGAFQAAELQAEVAELIAQLRSRNYGPGALDRCATLLKQFMPAALAVAPEAIPGEQWHEDDGACLWWRFPIVEPPWAGDPRDSDWPGYHTHFTRIVCPVLSVQGGEGK